MECNQATLSDIFGVSVPTLIKYRGLGMPVLREASGVGKAMTFDTVSVFEWMVQRRIDQLDIPDAPDILDSERELALLRRSQRALNEIKKAEQEAELIPADDAVRAWSAILTAFRSRILSVPPRMRSRLPDMPDAAYDELSHLLREALDELSRSDPLDSPESAGDSSAAA